MHSAITVSADSSPGNFEGPEKLLELWFAPDEQQVTGSHIENLGGRKGKAKWTGLRSVERSVWDSMLDEVQCKVLSVIEGEDVDAYLLRYVLAPNFFSAISRGARMEADATFECAANLPCSFGLISSSSKRVERPLSYWDYPLYSASLQRLADLREFGDAFTAGRPSCSPIDSEALTRIGIRRWRSSTNYSVG